MPDRLDEIERKHYAVEWQRCGEDGTPNPADPLPPFCAACTDEEYVGAIEFGDTIDESAGVVSWPCETLKLARELRDARAEIERLTKLHERHVRNLSGVAGGNMSGYTVAEVEAVEAELAAERAKVQRVEAVRQLMLTSPNRSVYAWATTDLRTALAGGEQ